MDNQFLNYDRMLRLVKRYFPRGIELVQDEWGMGTGGFLPISRCPGHIARENEIFHDNGEIDMAAMLRLYKKHHVDVPIRVDHVPLMAGEESGAAGYTALGRLYAIGYLKGLMEAIDKE